MKWPILSLKTLKNLPSGVWAISIASLFISVSTTMTFSISPFFITEVLGLTTFTMGILEGVSEALSQMMKLFSGLMGDLTRRKKPIIVLGLALAALSKLLFILAPGSGLIMASKALERISNGLIASPRDAYTALEAPPHKKGLCLGLLMTHKALGCTIGSWLMASLLLFNQNYQLLLWIGLLPAIAAVYIAMVYIRENPQKTQNSNDPTALEFSWKQIKRLPLAYWAIIGIGTLFMLARFSETFLVLRFRELGASTAFSVSVMGFLNIFSFLFCLPVGKLIDNYKKLPLLAVCFIILTLAHLCLSLSEGLSLALLGMVLWGIQRGTSQLLFMALIVDKVPASLLGTALGFFYLISGISALFAGSMAGWLSQHAMQDAFIYGSWVSSLSLILLFIFMLKSKPDS